MDDSLFRYLRTSSLAPNDLENFWIRVYLGSDSDLLSSSIDRAYRDFSRTQHGISKNDTPERYALLKSKMRDIVQQLLEAKFETQAEFDDWHQCKCNYLIDSYDELIGFKISFGQAQKWINMSLKYLYALGDARIPNISSNYQFFHVPIDNIIQEKLGMKLNGTCSRINTYDEYIAFQNKVRERFVGQIPMDVEFKLFNQLK